MLYIILGILAMAGVIIEEYVLGVFAPFTFMGINIFVVVPLGAFGLGAVVGGAMSKGMYLSNQRINIKKVMACIMMGILTFTGVKFMEYKTTYLVDDGDSYSVNRTFEGDPISEFSYYIGNEEVDMTFINYIKYELDNNDASFKMKHGQDITLDSKGKLNYIMFIVDFLALLIGTLCGMVYYISAAFCDKCNRYHREKEIFKASGDDIDYLLSLGDINMESYPLLKNFINDNKIGFKNKNKYIGRLSYCDECKDGKIIINKNNEDDGEFKETSIILDKNVIELMSK